MSGQESNELDGFSEPLPFNRQTANESPAEAGVTIVFDAQGEPLNVGYTKNIRDRLREHLQGDREASVLHEQVGAELDTPSRQATRNEIAEWLGSCTVSWQMTDNAKELKNKLVTRLRPRFNRQSVGSAPQKVIREKAHPIPGRWAEILHWATRYLESVDLDAEERQYKIQLAKNLNAAAEALATGNSEWNTLLRRSFGSPNNLTSWRMHDQFLAWVDANPALAASILRDLWDTGRDIHAAVEQFCLGLPTEVSGEGAKANLASFLLGAREVASYPIFRTTVFERAYRLTGWPYQRESRAADRYDEALRFLDAFKTQMNARRSVTLRDRLDTQGLLWQVLSGKPPATWKSTEAEAYRRFWEGQQLMDLDQLVAQFRAETGHPAEGDPRRNIERQEISAALTLEGLTEPDVRLLRRLAGSAYGSPGPQPGFNRLLQSDDGIARVTETLQFLLYGTGEIVDRLDACISGQRKLPGVGEAMLVKALAVMNPDRWIPSFVTNGKVGKTVILEAMGVPFVVEGTAGDAAAATNDLIRERLQSYFPNDPWGMQNFTWWLLHRERVPAEPLADLATELYVDEAFLNELLRLLQDKGQIVFYGPPGTGKTYLARKLAGHIARGGGSVEKVQFHPSYAYEDFVEGYRPKLVNGSVSYEIVDGPLKRIAATAQERQDVDHVLLIDELNRANVAKVLGEMLFLLEYRDEEIRLQYSEAPFSLPENLQIIATMNTADRSVALVDTALRRRFHFVPFFPDVAPINGVLRRWLADRNPQMSWVADVVDSANTRLAERHMAIGPSHFLKDSLTEEDVRLTWKYSVMPFLEDHFFGDPDQLASFDLEKLRATRANSVSLPVAVDQESSSG